MKTRSIETHSTKQCRLYSSFLLMLPFLFCVHSQAHGSQKVSLEIFASKANVAAYPIEIGLPFPPGALSDASKIRLLNQAGTEVPCQVKELTRYVDGSLRAVLLIFLSPISKEKAGAYHIEFGNDVSRSAKPKTALTVSKKGDQVEVDTGAGALTFQVAKNKKLFTNVFANGKPILPEGLEQFIQESGSTELLFSKQTEVIVEEKGPLRAVILIKGRFGDSTDAHSYQVRIHAYAGTGLIRLQHTVLGLDAKKAFELSGWGLRAPIAANSAGCGIGGVIKELDVTKGETLFQDTVFEWTWGPLGDEELRKRAKVRAKFKIGEGFGWRYRMRYTLGKTEPLDGKADGWMHAQTASNSIACSVRDFWQQCPKAFAADKEALTIWLHSPQGKPFIAKAGTAKTHEILLNLTNGNQSPEATQSLNAVFQDWPLARVSPKWVCDTGIFGPLLPRDDPFSAPYNKIVDLFMAFIKETSETIVNRTCWYLYGNAEFGDFRNSAFCNVPMGVTRGLTLEFLRGGDRECARLGARAARHYGDIDVCHAKTTESEPGRMWIVDKKSARKPAIAAGSTHGFNHKLLMTTGAKREALLAKIQSAQQGFNAVALPRDVHQYNPFGGKGTAFVGWTHHTGGAMPYYLLSGDRRSLEVIREQVAWILKTRSTASYLRNENTFQLNALMEAHAADGDVKYLKGASLVIKNLIALWKKPLEQRRSYKREKAYRDKRTPEQMKKTLASGFRLKGQPLPSHGYWQLGYAKRGAGGIISISRRSLAIARFLTLNVSTAETGVDNDEVKRMLSECVKINMLRGKGASGCTPGYILSWAVAEQLGLWSEPTRKLFEERTMLITSNGRKTIPYEVIKNGMKPSPALKYKLPFMEYKLKYRASTGKFVTYDPAQMAQHHIFNRSIHMYTCDMAEYGINYVLPTYPHFVAVWKKYHEKHLTPRMNKDGEVEYKIVPIQDAASETVADGDAAGPSGAPPLKK